MRTMDSAFSIRPYVEESTASCPICEVKSQSACGSSWVGDHQRTPGVECNLLGDILMIIIDTRIQFRRNIDEHQMLGSESTSVMVCCGKKRTPGVQCNLLDKILTI